MALSLCGSYSKCKYVVGTRVCVREISHRKLKRWHGVRDMSLSVLVSKICYNFYTRNPSSDGTKYDEFIRDKDGDWGHIRCLFIAIICT